MSVIAIVFLSVCVLYIFSEMFRESQRKKWYKKGFLDAKLKHDSDYPSYNDWDKDADELFDEQYGFHYD